MNEYKIPFALFNSKALFNPYQYLPFEKIMEWEEGKDGEDGRNKLNGKNLLITDEVGVGKTFEAGIILQELIHNDRGVKVLILCPVKLCANWVKELKENFFIGAVNYRERKTLGQITVVPYSAFSGKSCRTEQEETAAENELKEDKEDSGQEKNNELIEQIKEQLGDYDVLILDEAHYVRNRGQLWLYIKELEQLENKDSGLRVFMTGTPIFNRKADLNNIKELLKKTKDTESECIEPEITRTLQGEANCYDYMLNIHFGGITKDEKPGNLICWSPAEETIYNEISSVILKVDYDPETGEEKIREVSKYGRQAGIMKQYSASSFYSLIKWVKEYSDKNPEDDFEEEWFDEEDEDTEERGEIKDILGLDEVKDYCPGNDSKLTALKELLEWLKKNDNKDNFKAIIFSRFYLTCEYLDEQLKADYAVRMITGKTNVNDVEKIKLEFENYGNPIILICSDAAKEGHNLQFCHNLIHYDLPFAPAVIGQRNGRIYRKGQQGNPECYYMLMGLRKPDSENASQSTDDNSEDYKMRLAGYDDRLFGEIIADKCALVEDAANKKLVSKMNILPKDSTDITRKYLDDYFEVSDKIQNRERTDKEIAAIKKKRAQRLLKKRYSDFLSNNGSETAEEDINWFSKVAKQRYEELKLDVENDLNTVLESIKNLIISDFENNKNLQELYISKYNQKIQEFIANHFMPESETSINDDKTDWNQEFIIKCREYLTDLGYSDSESEYCHDVMEKEMEIKNGSSTVAIDIGEYKKNFVPLVKQVRNNGEQS